MLRSIHLCNGTVRRTLGTHLQSVQRPSSVYQCLPFTAQPISFRTSNSLQQLASFTTRSIPGRLPYTLQTVPQYTSKKPITLASVRRFATAAQQDLKTRNRRIAIYVFAVVIAGVGVSYAAVPLYKIFCQAYGFGGTTQTTTASRAATMMPVPGSQPIRVTFSGTVADTLGWKFKPQQREVKVVPGETALAFYTAYNPTDSPVTGVATYNVQPAKAGIYFNKIQCFCFDEQRLKPKEEVDMPIFFFIDPEFANDPQMRGVNDICLSYVFFKAKDQEDED